MKEHSHYYTSGAGFEFGQKRALVGSFRIGRNCLPKFITTWIWTKENNLIKKKITLKNVLFPNTIFLDVNISLLRFHQTNTPHTTVNPGKVSAESMITNCSANFVAKCDTKISALIILYCASTKCRRCQTTGT